MKLSKDLTRSLLELNGIPPPIVDEKSFQAAVEALARRHGWLVYHTRDSRKSAAGFPDLVCVKGCCVIFAELKSADGIPSADQLTWGESLARVGGAVAYYLWRHADWPEIERILSIPALQPANAARIARAEI